jgi:hypothetical protein
LVQILRWQDTALDVSRQDTNPQRNNSTDDAAADADTYGERPAKRSKTKQAANSCKPATGSKPAQASSTKLRLVLNLQDADQEPAAMAVLAALYNARP